LGHNINQDELSRVSDNAHHLETKTQTIEVKENTEGFRFPVGKKDQSGYYNAQEFGVNDHLGEDWNGIGGGNTDLGDPIYAVANGYVKFAEDHGHGWGNVIRIVHFLPNNTVVESLYAHCDSIMVPSNSWVKQGEVIGTIGSANGLYPAHLHFEMRKDTSLSIGGGYGSDNTGYISPTAFILNNR